MYYGRISVAHIAKDTKRVKGHAFTNHNIIGYSGADILAQLLSGNRSYIPGSIGFIYAPSGASPAPLSDRNQTWDQIASDVKTINGNMIVSQLGSNPFIAIDGPTDRYDGNAVTFNAVSDATADLVFSGTGYASAAPTPGADKFFQVVLLASVYTPGSTVPSYVPYARAELGSGIDVATDTELAVYWTQVFK
jgi:hypothetical protein